MVSPLIAIERADNARRKLSHGYEWQEYTIAALKVVDKTTFQTTHGSIKSNMEDEMGAWENAVKRYVNDKCDELGIWVGSMTAQMIEEPNESKLMEVYLWHARDAEFVWSVWAKLFGPVPSDAWSPVAMPLFRFWPREVHMEGQIPEIVDAAMLSILEQDHR